MKPIVINNLTTGLESHNLRRPFQFGKVVARSSHFIPCSAYGQGVLGISASLTMDPWSLRGRFESECYSIMPKLVKLCASKCNEMLKEDRTPRTPPQYWDWLFAECFKAAKAEFGDDFPKLAVAVAMAAMEFAIWDLYGKVQNLPWAKCLSSEFLGDEDLSSVVRDQPLQKVVRLHTIGGKDCLFSLDDEGMTAVNDGLPETVFDEVYTERSLFLKPKVTGDFDFDVARLGKIDLLVARLQQQGRIGQIGYFFDANGACPDISWLARFLEKAAKAQHGADRVLSNFEQPFSVDNTFTTRFLVSSLAGYCDFSIDESLVEVGDVARAQAHGYNRLGVKVCKSVTETLRILHAARQLGMYCDMQDLTQIGRGLLVSASVAAWCGLRIESNGGKNVVNAKNAFGSRVEQFRGLTVVENGCFNTGNLTGSGFDIAD